MQVLRVGDAHVQLASGDAFDACVDRPRACFELQLTVFDSELSRTFLLLLELAEQSARQVLGGDEAERARREKLGAGRARRSIFPLGVSGSASSGTNSSGTI